MTETDKSQAESAQSQGPAWFAEAIAHEPQEYQLEFGSHLVAWRSANGTGARQDQHSTPVLLIHGYSAHSRWFDHVAPQLLAACSTVWAIDLYGMGNSEHRDSYSVEDWSQQVQRAIQHILADTGANQVDIVAHSMGGGVAIQLLADCQQVIRKTVLLDAVPVRDPEALRQLGPMSKRREVAYKSLSQAVSYYRVIPSQNNIERYVLAHVAEHAYRETEQGWLLKTDPDLGVNLKRKDLTEVMVAIDSPIYMINGSMSTHTSADNLTYMMYVGQTLPTTTSGATRRSPSFIP